MTWHPSPGQLQAYGTAGLSVSQAWSIESHISACAECRQVVSADDPDRLDEIWQATLDRIDAPRGRLIERGLVAAGVPDYLARLLGATPSLTVPWLLAVVAVLGFGLAMAWNSNAAPVSAAQPGLLLFLVLAPVMPVAGVALAFGPVADPAHEVAVASPFHGFRLLLVRTVAVVAASMTIALGLALLLPGAGLMTAAWIVPGLALAALTLAASTFVPPLVAAGGSTALWLGGVLASEAGPDTLVAFGWTGQLLFVFLLLAAVALLLARRDTFEIAG